MSVSYTHLDVYKRQRQTFGENQFSGYPHGTSQDYGSSFIENSPLANLNLTWEKAHKLNIEIGRAHV